MKAQRPTQVKNARKLSDAIIARRYLDLQRLRDEVRTAEISCALQGSQKPQDRSQLARLGCPPINNLRPSFGEQR
jgi:hypothetical protein